MKSLRTVIIGLTMLGLIAFLSGVSLAQEARCKEKTRHEVKIKLLQDASAALQKSNPGLAKGLTDYANEEIKEAQDWQAKHAARVKLLQDSATALQQLHPDLANALQKMSEGKWKKETVGMSKGKNEQEEPGETVEPASEQGENANK